jgi:hypothetical protein
VSVSIGAAATGALSGVRVIDLTINVLGPVATQSLGDMGAEVLKIESPQGDPMRETGTGRHPGMSAFYLNMNRNKKSVVLDLKRPEARDALLELVRGADVFVHSMRARAAERLGLGYAALAAINPRLVYATAPGYSPDGPQRDRPAYDDVIQGESGLAGMMETVVGMPRYLPTVAADKLCGVFLASAVGMALYARERTGQGQEVHVPMLETMLSFNLVEHLWDGVFGGDGKMGSASWVRPWTSASSSTTRRRCCGAAWQRWAWPWPAWRWAISANTCSTIRPRCSPPRSSVRSASTATSASPWPAHCMARPALPGRHCRHRPADGFSGAAGQRRFGGGAGQAW